MSADLTFSVIIPCFNAERTILECLAALFDALPDSSEVIVIDDGSTDATVSLTKKYPCKLIELGHNQGAGPARNAGIAVAKGEIIVFIDSDIVIHSDLFERLTHDFIGEEKPDAVVGMFSGKCPFDNFPSLYKLHLQRSYHFKTPKWTNALFTAISAVKRSALERSGLFDETIKGATYEDVELGKRLVNNGYHLLFDSGIIGDHKKKYSFFELITTQFFRAKGMGNLFFSHSGTSEISKTGRFLSIPFSFGISLLIGPLFLCFILIIPYSPLLSTILSILLLCILVGLNFTFLTIMYKSGKKIYALYSVLFLPIDFSIGAFGALTGWFFGFLKSINKALK